MVVTLVVAEGVDSPVGRAASEGSGSLTVPRGTLLEACLVSSGGSAVTRLEGATVSHANTTQADAVADTGSYQGGVANDSWTNDTGTDDARNHTNAVARHASQNSATSFNVLLILLFFIFLSDLFGERGADHEGEESEGCEELRYKN